MYSLLVTQYVRWDSIQAFMDIVLCSMAAALRGLNKKILQTDWFTSSKYYTVGYKKQFN